MKKSVFILILVIAFFTSGCANKAVQAPQIKEKDSTAQNDFSRDDVSSGWDDYMTSVEEQSNSIKAFLEYEAVTQLDMNMKSQELYTLWDDALNALWGELKINLPEEEFEKLQAEQHIWIAEKERAVEEAGKEVEGGSVYPLVVNSEAAKITEERVYELYALLKELFA